MKRSVFAYALFSVFALHTSVGHGQPQAADSGPSADMQVSGAGAPCVRIVSDPELDREPLDCLEPGTRLRVLANRSGWSHVRLLDGTEGWADSSYLEAAPTLSSDPPTERQEELTAAELRQALAAAEARLEAAEQRGSEQARRIDTLTGELADAEVRAAKAELKSRLANRREPSMQPPLEGRVKVRMPIVSAPEAPKVSVQMPVAVPEEDIAAPLEEPVEEPVPATDAAINAVQAWAAAWSNQRVDDYLSFYSPSFEPPNGLSRSEWEAQRRQRLSKPRYIRVTISSLSAQQADDGTVTATFQQGYESDTFADTVTKVLTLAEDDGTWRLLAEQATP